jgi:hypothetical protein
MTGSVLFVLPDGRSAEVAESPSRLIRDRLWDQGLAVGAVTAAVRISEALHTHPAFRPDVTFQQREVAALIEAARVHPPTWTLLLRGSDLPALTAAQRERLLEVCQELIDALGTRHEQSEAGGLGDELEGLRDTLRALRPD